MCGVASAQSPEDVLGGIERQLAGGSLRATVTGQLTTSSAPVQSGSYRGTLTLHESKLALRLESLSGRSYRLRVVSDGAQVQVESWAREFRCERARATSARDFWAKATARAGLGAAFTLASTATLVVPPPAADRSFRVKSPQLKGQVLTYLLDVGAPSDCKVTLWLNPDTRLPTKRRVEFELGPSQTLILSESYRWESKPRIEAGAFKVEPEPATPSDLKRREALRAPRRQR